MSAGDVDEGRIEALLAAMTLEEKVRLRAGADAFTTEAIARLGVPALAMNDGPTGARSNDSAPATVFPVATALAATWNANTVAEVGAAIARESAAIGSHVLLAPGVNLQRTPRGGRSFEYFSEDPLLAGKLGAAYVRGVQSEGIAATVKHFAANNQEANRFKASSQIDPRTLRELYLRVWEIVLEESHPWAIMCAYNALNDAFAAENPWLLTDILKREWGYDGLVMSDWGAVHHWRASDAGLDLEMPGPPKRFGAALLAAAEAGEADATALDDGVRRLLRLIARTRCFDGGDRSVAAAINTEAHQAIARAAAAESIVLLKNDGALLPLNPTTIQTLAVIGQAAAEPAIQGGGSSQVAPFRLITPLEGLREAFGSERVRYAMGVNRETRPVDIPPHQLSPDRERMQAGLRARYFAQADLAGRVVEERVETVFSKLGFAADARAADGPGFSVVWEGWFWPQESGVHQFSIGVINPLEVSLEIDGQPVIAPDQPPAELAALATTPLLLRAGSVTLTADTPVPIRVVASRPPQAPDLFWMELFLLGLRQPDPSFDAAVEAARGADAAVVFVGTPRSGEAEGHDRPGLGLGAAQDRLAAAVAAANANTIVVLNAGAPVLTPWAEAVSAIVQMWMPGQEGGVAIADVLTGKINPSGHLPHSMPRRLEDNPTHAHYSTGLEHVYGEGLFVGYRWYDKTAIAPAFPFGHGLSYTHFELKALSAEPNGGGCIARLRVRNAGVRAGGVAVQLYLAPENPREAAALRTLAGFEKLFLEPGETRELTIPIPPKAFQYFDRRAGGWAPIATRFTLHAGLSAEDLRLAVPFALQ